MEPKGLTNFQNFQSMQTKSRDSIFSKFRSLISNSCITLKLDLVLASCRKLTLKSHLVLSRLAISCITVGTMKLKHKNDISNFETFLSVLRIKRRNILVSSITLKDIENLKNILTEKTNLLTRYKGTIKVHQWSVQRNLKVVFDVNSVNCFDSWLGTKCQHYHLGAWL